MKKIKFFFTFALAVASMSIVSCSSDSSKAEKADATENEAVETVVAEVPNGVAALEDDAMFRPDKAVQNVTVLDFNATWCIPCKKLTPAYDKAAEEFAGKVAFYSVDIDKNPQTKEAFGIENVPTVIILYPDGKMSKSVGLGDFATEEQLKDASADELTEIIYGNLVNMIQR